MKFNKRLCEICLANDFFKILSIISRIGRQSIGIIKERKVNQDGMGIVVHSEVLFMLITMITETVS